MDVEPILIESARLAVEVLTGIVSVSALVIAYVTRRNAARRAQLEAMRADIVKVGERVTSVEAQQTNLPTHGEIGKIHGRLDALGREIAGIASTSSATERLVGRMNQYLMERAR